MINPAEIPQIPGDMGALGQHAAAVTGLGSSFADTGARVHATWQGLAPVYSAPESGQLLAATGPVQAITASVGQDLSAVGGALSAYATEVAAIKARLESLRAQAVDFVGTVGATEDWREDQGAVDRHNRMLTDVNAAVADFQDAQRRCANAILALYSDLRYSAENGDGTIAANEFGYTAEMLNGALAQGEALPWGGAEEHDRGFFGDVGAFFVGIKDGAVEMVKGLGALIGYADGQWSWGTAGAAWKGLGTFALSLSPGLLVLNNYTDLPGLPKGTLQDTLVGAGKALIAYDTWGEDKSKAAGMATFNIVSAIVGTKGAGAALRGGGAAVQASRFGTVARVGAGMVRAGEFIGRLPSAGDLASSAMSRFPGFRVPNIDLPNVDVPPTHVDTPSVQTPRADIPSTSSPSVGDALGEGQRAQPPSVDAPARPDTPRADTPSTAAADAPARPDAPRVDAPGTAADAPARPDAPRADAPGTAAAADAPTRPDAPRVDTPGTAAADAPPRPDAPRADAPGTAAADAPQRPDAPRVDTPGTAADAPVRPDSPRVDAPATAADAPLRPEAPGLDAPSAAAADAPLRPDAPAVPEGAGAGRVADAAPAPTPHGAEVPARVEAREPALVGAPEPARVAEPALVGGGRGADAPVTAGAPERPLVGDGAGPRGPGGPTAHAPENTGRGGDLPPARGDVPTTGPRGTDVPARAGVPEQTVVGGGRGGGIDVPPARPDVPAGGRFDADAPAGRGADVPNAPEGPAARGDADGPGARPDADGSARAEDRTPNRHDDDPGGPGDGDRPDGDAPSTDGPDGDGDRPDGDTPDGDTPDGDGPNGDGPNGDGPNGDGPDGDGPDGDGPDGDGPDGDGPDGDGPDDSSDTGGTGDGTSSVASGPEKARLIAELQASGVRINPDAVVRIGTDPNGRIVWLEEGGVNPRTNKSAGLLHVREEHEADFGRVGVDAADIPELVHRAVTEGRYTGMAQGKRIPGRPIFEIEFQGRTQYVAVSVGRNGFIVGASPRSPLHPFEGSKVTPDPRFAEDPTYRGWEE